MATTGIEHTTVTARSRTARTMKAGVYRGAGRVEVEYVPVPEIRPDEVLIRVAACGICGTDIKKIQRGFVQPPQIFGHEISGTVARAGDRVRGWKPGDRVVCFHHIPCGGCFYCHRKLFSQCATYKRVGVTAGFEPNGGGFSEYVRVMPWVVERGLIPIPEDVSFDEAAFVEPVNTCWKAIHKARLTAGETVVVLGQGPIGLLHLLLARHAGARVLTGDPLPERRRKSLALGAEASCDPGEGSLQAAILERTEGRGADVVLVAAPFAALLQQALDLARPGGRVLAFAYNDPKLRVDFQAAAVGVEEKEILGSYSADFEMQRESARLVFDRVLPVRELITHRFPLDEIREALALAAHPSEGSLKVVLNP